MVYTNYQQLEAGFLKEAAEQGCDVTFLEGMLKEAAEIQHKWAEAFDELEQITGDKTIKIKIGNDLAQIALMKMAEGEKGWMDSPMVQQLLSSLQQGGGQGALAGGAGGGLIGLILGLLTKNPMMGLMLGGLGGAGLGGLGWNRIKDFFGGKGNASPDGSTSPEESPELSPELAGAPSDPSQLPTEHNDPEAALRSAAQGSPEIAGGNTPHEMPGEHSDPEAQIAQQLSGVKPPQPGQSSLEPQGQQPLGANPQQAMMEQPYQKDDYDVAVDKYMQWMQEQYPQQQSPRQSFVQQFNPSGQGAGNVNQPMGQRPMVPKPQVQPHANPTPNAAQQAPMSGGKPLNTTFPSIPMNSHMPQIGKPAMPPGGGMLPKTGGLRLKLADLMSGPSMAPQGPASPNLNMLMGPGQPTTTSQNPMLPKGTPIVYPVNNQPRQMTSNYAVAPKTF